MISDTPTSSAAQLELGDDKPTAGEGAVISDNRLIWDHLFASSNHTPNSSAAQL